MADLGTDARITPQRRRAIFTATMLGNIVEYYDFTLYGTLAAVIADQYFPAHDPTVALLGVYVGIVLSYAIRPIGSLLLGPIGDRKGRKFVLILTIALMTIGTAGIGALPTYPAIGVAAPILLLTSRLLQGIGASVEYTTASNFLLEHERGNRRNLITGTSTRPARSDRSSQHSPRTFWPRRCQTTPSPPGAGASRSCSHSPSAWLACGCSGVPARAVRHPPSPRAVRVGSRRVRPLDAGRHAAGPGDRRQRG